MRQLVVAIVALHALDVALTLVGFGLGFSEANPLGQTAWRAAGLSGFVVMKIGALLSLAGCVRLAPVALRLALVTGNATGAAVVVAYNLAVLMGAI